MPCRYKKTGINGKLYKLFLTNQRLGKGKTHMKYKAIAPLLILLLAEPIASTFLSVKADNTLMEKN
jgi:hypothetical protein